MRRRDFLSAIAASRGVLPSVARSQPHSESSRARIVGYLAYQAPGLNPIRDEIIAEMRPLGWIENKTITYDSRYASGDAARLPAMAAELVARPVDLILAPNRPAAVAAQAATRTIPIVTFDDDMLASGLVASFAHPGGNTTGVSIFASELDAKRLDLLTELMPKARRIAGLADSLSGPSVPQVMAAARKLGVELVMFAAGDAQQRSARRSTR